MYLYSRCEWRCTLALEAIVRTTKTPGWRPPNYTGPVIIFLISVQGSSTSVRLLTAIRSLSWSEVTNVCRTGISPWIYMWSLPSNCSHLVSTSLKSGITPKAPSKSLIGTHFLYQHLHHLQSFQHQTMLFKYVKHTEHYQKRGNSFAGSFKNYRKHVSTEALRLKRFSIKVFLKAHRRRPSS